MRSAFVVVLLAAAASACSGADKPAAPIQQGTKRVDAATAGSVAGRVTFAGQAPAPAVLRTSADPACGQGGNTITDESLIVDGSGGLKNALVHIKDSFGDYIFDVPPDPFVLDNKGCRYEPHVFAVRVGQPLRIVNSDATLHNVHGIPQKNTEFNKGLSLQGMSMTETFNAPEIGIPFKCDVHGWMTSYGHVMAHPYFAITDASGNFSLPNVPPGTYTLEVWHEKLGTRTQSITIAPKQSAQASFTFSQN